MADRLTRRTVMLGLASAAASIHLPSAAAEPSEGHGIEREGATLTRFATGLPGAEMTGLFITADGQFFFNVQHPDVDDDDEYEPGIVGAVTGVDMTRLPTDFPSVQLPDDEDTEVRTAVGDYQRLARGGDPTGDGEALGSVYTPDGDYLTGQTHPDFNGFVPSTTAADEGYLFTNWEHWPGTVSRLHLKQRGRNGRWEVLDSENLDFSAVEGTWQNCFGTVSPWDTPLTSEENYLITDTADWNNPDWDDDEERANVDRLARHLGYAEDDGVFENGFPNPYRYGYIVELEEPEGTPRPVKRFGLGRSTHENAVVMPDCRTAYTTSDGTARGFYKFVADEPCDLSAGTLYAAKATQNGPAGGDTARVSFGLEWIELAHGTDAAIESWIADYDDITQADYEGGETSYITDAEIEAWAAGEADDDRVAFLETRAAAEAMGATIEFRKMEGVNARRNATAGDYLYVAMSNTNATMSDDEGDIRLGDTGGEWGAVYRLPLQVDYDVREMEPIITGGPDANICGGCPYDANPHSNDRACRSCAFNPTVDEDRGPLSGTMNLAKSMALSGQTSLDPANTVAEPDNIVVMDDGRVVIGEDTGNEGHERNMIWVFDPGNA